MTDHDSCQWQWRIVYADHTYMELVKTSHAATLVDCILNLELVTRVWSRWMWSYNLAAKVMNWVWDQDKIMLEMELTPEQLELLNPDNLLED